MAGALPVPSPPYPGERVRGGGPTSRAAGARGTTGTGPAGVDPHVGDARVARGHFQLRAAARRAVSPSARASQLDARPLTLTLSPEYRGEGTGVRSPAIGRLHVVATLPLFIAIACLALLGGLAGCNSLPAGQLHVLGGRDEPAKPAPVVLFRGWRDLWSDGVDRLADELRADGLDAAVFKHGQAADVTDVLAARARADALPPPVVVVGFSYGADDAIDLARRLDGYGRAVDLLVLIDPVTPAAVPPAVRRCANFYQSNGVLDALPWLRGVPVKAADPALASRVVNVDVRARADLLEEGTSHKTIAGNAKLHAAIRAEVRDAMRAAAATRAADNRKGDKGNKVDP
jgi:surfactin synthase thioesterase subunit